MTTTSIGTTSTLPTPTTPDLNSVLGTSGATFGDNPFMQLLTAQLKNQTPLQPVDNTSFMNQMASYSTMQQQSQLNANLLKLLDYQGALARMQGLSEGSALLGKEVTYAGDGGAEAHGTVQSVFVTESGDVKLKLTDSKEIDLRAVLGIAQQAPAGS
jgi:flagellar basal-body rod modification protein FlgD